MQIKVFGFFNLSLFQSFQLSKYKNQPIQTHKTGAFIKPFQIGFHLSALRLIFISPTEKIYLSLALASLCLNKKENIPTFTGIKNNCEKYHESYLANLINSIITHKRWAPFGTCIHHKPRMIKNLVFVDVEI